MKLWRNLKRRARDKKLREACTCEGHEHSLSLGSDCTECDCCPHMKRVKFKPAPYEGHW